MQDTPPGETLDPTRKNWRKGLNKFQATKNKKTGIHKESKKHMHMYMYIYISHKGYNVHNFIQNYI